MHAITLLVTNCYFYFRQRSAKGICVSYSSFMLFLWSWKFILWPVVILVLEIFFKLLWWFWVWSFETWLCPSISVALHVRKSQELSDSRSFSTVSRLPSAYARTNKNTDHRRRTRSPKTADRKLMEVAWRSNGAAQKTITFEQSWAAICIPVSRVTENNAPPTSWVNKTLVTIAALQRHSSVTLFTPYSATARQWLGKSKLPPYFFGLEFVIETFIGREWTVYFNTALSTNYV